MAMTKAEKAHVEDLERNLAFRWPTDAEPIPMSVPGGGDGERVGYVFNTHNTMVDWAWSTSVSHGRFFEGKRGTGSQKGVPLYETERDAHVAMRWAMCREFAGKLRNVDKRASLVPPIDGVKLG